MKKATEKRINLLSAWSGMVFLLLTFVGMIVLAGFFPPPSPANTTQQVMEMYQVSPNKVRAGLVMMMFGAAMFIPFTALMTHYISRIEGKLGVLSIMQIMGGYSNMILFFYPPLWWLITCFNLDRDPELIHMLHDAAWLQFLGALTPFLFMLASVAIAAFVDDSEKPVFPRWLGWLSLFSLIAFLPDQMIFFFKTGPFAWNGIFGWWIPLVSFFTWISVMFYVMRKAVIEDL